jgi:hypothetical protein
MRRALPSLALTLSLAAACAAPGTVPPGTAGGEGADPCGPQLVVFVNAGDLLATPPRRDGRADPEALAAELARENAAIERLQIAFDALFYCRWTEVRLIRAEGAAGAIPPAELPRRLQAAEGRLRADLGRAGAIRAALGQRSARIEAAVEGAAPGSFRAAPRGAGLPRALASAPVVLRLRPEGDAPVVHRLPTGTEVTLRPVGGGFAFADAGGGRSGYAAAGAFTLRPAAPAEAEGGGTAARLRSLAATNIARREAFAEAVQIAERSLARGGEPGGG